MHVSFVTMPYKDPEKRREFERRWRDRNREKLRAKQRERKRVRDLCVRDLRVVLTPLTRTECQVPIERLQRRKAVTRDAECRACAERARERKEEAKRRKLERNREWKKANREKVRESKRKWRENNREKVREQKRQWYQNNRERVMDQKRQWAENNPEKVRESKRQWEKKRVRQPSDLEKRRERKRKWRENNREKDREQRRRQRQANPEKTREQQRTWYQSNRERVMEQKRQWRKNNPEKVRAQKERRRERLRTDEARGQAVKEKGRVQQQRWRHEHPEEVRVRQRQWRQANREKLRAQRERYREADRAYARQYYATHKEHCNQKRKERYYKKRGRPVPPPPPPCDCGVCLACGGWGVSWKPAWYARLNAFSTPQDQSTATTPATILEELPSDLSESEAETLSLASTSEIASELGDRLEALLMDESDSEVETGDKVDAPTRRSKRIATLPSVSYKDWEEEEKLISEFLKRKTQLHAEGVDRIVTRWELLEHRTERVDAIVEEMSMGMDPAHQLDRFYNQLERQDHVLDVMVSEDLLDFVDAQLA